MGEYQFSFNEESIDGISIGAVSTLVVAANSSRNILTLVNDSSQDIYIALGTDAILNKGRRLNKRGGTFTISGEYPYKGAIYAICITGGANLCLAYA